MKQILMAGKYPINLLDHRVEKHDFTNWEKPYLLKLMETLKPGMVVYDIGAEEGEFTALAASAVGGRNVHIFEPAPRVWNNIREVWTNNFDVEPGGCFPGFAGDEDSEDRIIILHGFPKCAYEGITFENAFGHYLQHPHLPRITLDTYAEKFGRSPDVVMMDVEGSEIQVVRGMKRLLKERPPIVFMSMHSEERLAEYGGTKEGLLGVFAAAGYTSENYYNEWEDHWLFLPTP